MVGNLMMLSCIFNYLYHPYLKVLARREMIIPDLGYSLALELSYTATKHAAP